MSRHFAICATILALVQPTLGQEQSASFLDHIEAARHAVEICPNLRIDEQRIAELMQTLHTPRSLMTKSLDEADMALVQPPSPAQQPPTAGASPGPAVDPACAIALADYGPDGARLAGLLEAVPSDPPQ